MKAEPISKKISAVVDTLSADLLTPLSVYLKLAHSGASSFLLESVEGGETLARYSFVGVDPEFVVSGGDQSVNVTRNGSSKTIPVSMLNFLRDELSSVELDAEAGMPPFMGGAIGYMGFDCCGWFEPKLRPGSEPISEFMFFRSIVAFDHVKQIVRLISLQVETDEPSLAKSRNAELRRSLEDSRLDVPRNASEETNKRVTSNWERPDFESAVLQIKEMINAGEAYQVVLSQCFTRHTNASPVAIYRAVRSLNPSPYLFLLQIGERSIIGASPEMLVKCTDGRLEYRPIAGTRPRGKTPAEDNAFAEEMRLDEKEVAEHMMLVDLGRNDLGRVAEYGSVNVDALMNVEKYSHVQHLVSALSAKLRRGMHRFDALAACFPAGTVSGAPKVRAIEIIRDLEPTKRGVYAGAVGHFDYTGNMDMCIAIRTLVIENGVATIQAGAGIVADSVPELEFEETVNKAKVMLRAIEIAEDEGF